MDFSLSPMVLRLLVINVAVSFLLLIGIRAAPETFTHVVEWLALTPQLVVGKGYVWTLVTYLFVHLEPTHLIFNMLGLVLLGTTLERMWGSRSFLRFMLLSGVVAGLSVLVAGLLFSHFAHPTVGLSGSLNALLMAYAVLFPNQSMYFYGFVPIKGKHLVAIIVVMEVLYALAGSTASLPAHLGGLLAGYLLVTGKWRPSRWFPRDRRKGGGRLKVVRNYDHDSDKDGPPSRRYLN